MLMGYLGLYALIGLGPGKHPGARLWPAFFVLFLASNGG